MSELKFLVTVNTERESGMHASREEISELLIEEIASSVEAAQLSNLGPHGTSEYSVDNVDVEELDNKAARELWKDNDRAVKDETPNKSEALKQLRVANGEIAKLKSELARAETKLAAAAEVREAGRTKIWAGPRYEEEGRIYLPDGQYDNVVFQLEDKRATHESRRFPTVSVSLEDGVLKLYSGDQNLISMNMSMNNMVIKAQEFYS